MALLLGNEGVLQIFLEIHAQCSHWTICTFMHQEAAECVFSAWLGLGHGGWLGIISARSDQFEILKSPASFRLADYTYLLGKPSTCFPVFDSARKIWATIREILRSALTLSKKLYDIPTQNWVLSNLTALYQQSGEKGSEMENLEYQRRKIEDLQQRLATARSSVHHNELIEKVKLQVQQLNEQDMKRAIAGPSKSIDLDIPESVGLLTPQPMPSSARLMYQDIGRLRKRKV
ncbi:UNVERIFIED_CONTAM: Sister chromatid cohesion protein SCC4 [Sesamum radiatum]|uniref:Sister chromatid cohesion protein SCC4 n=1 Tax=Sesamum radiatum TaxID=300843 RepID=A0AAW2W429_SESRA